MDKRWFLASKIIIIFFLLTFPEISGAKSTDKKQFLKEYDKIDKLIKENNYKRTKKTFKLFSELEKKYDLTKIKSKQKIAFLYFNICEGKINFSEIINHEVTAKVCEKAYILNSKAGVYKIKNAKWLEMYLIDSVAQAYTQHYFISNDKKSLLKANQYTDKILENLEIKKKNYNAHYVNALKNKVFIYKAKLNIKKAIEYQEKIFNYLGCNKTRSELTKSFLQECAIQNSDYAHLLTEIGTPEVYEKVKKILENIIMYENEDDIDVYTKNAARTGLFLYYKNKRNFDEAEKYIYDSVVLLKNTRFVQTYYDNVRKLYSIYSAKGQGFEAKQGLKKLILEIENKYGSESPQLILPISDYINHITILDNINDNEEYAEKLIKIIEKNKKLKKNQPYAYVALGSYYFKIKKYDLSEKFFEKSLKFQKYRNSQFVILKALSKINLEKYEEAEKIINKFEYQNSKQKMLLMFAKNKLYYKTSNIHQYEKSFVNLYYNIFDYSRGITSEEGNLSINQYNGLIMELIRDVTKLNNDDYKKIEIFFNNNNENLDTSIIELIEILRNSKINKSVKNVIDRSSTPELEVEKKKLQNLILEFEKLPKISDETQNTPNLAKQLANYKKKIFNQQKFINSKLNIKNSLYYDKIDKKLLEKNIKKNQALISYFIDKEQLFLNYLSKEKILIKKIDINKNEISNYVSAIRNSILIDENKKLKKFDFKNSSKLYQIILKPIEKEIDDKNELIIIPHKSLMSLPFEVLIKDYDNQDNYSNTKWLGKNYSISYHPSIYSYLNLKNITFEKTNNELVFLGLGDPKFKTDEKFASKKADLAKLMLRNVGNIEEINKMTELPETADELRIISNIFNNQSKLILGKEFTENKIKSMDLSNFKYIAFATHAIVANQITNIVEPGLILTPPNNPTTKDDGILTVSEINKLNLKSDIVILSACNTASEDGSPNGEGLSGLTSAFFQAGTKSMLVTHWDVETNSAVQLTTGSLKNLENSESLSKALQKTKISMMNNKDTAHPFYWAPFVLIGNLNVQN